MFKRSTSTPSKKITTHRPAAARVAASLSTAAALVVMSSSTAAAGDEPPDETLSEEPASTATEPDPVEEPAATTTEPQPEPEPEPEPEPVEEPATTEPEPVEEVDAPPVTEPDPVDAEPEVEPAEPGAATSEATPDGRAADETVAVESTPPDATPVAGDANASDAGGDAASTAKAAVTSTPAKPSDSTNGPRQPSGRSNFAAVSYDGVYAQGVPIGVALATTRWIESRSNYGATDETAASGAYRIVDDVWDDYGGFTRAAEAPPHVQDRFAYEAIVEILKANDGEAAMIPVIWYSKNATLETDRPTVAEYQAQWLARFDEELRRGSPVFLPPDSSALVPAIAFPVLGPVSFVNDWHFERDGGARAHEGLDFMGTYGQPLRAAFSGEVVRLVATNEGISGVSIELRRGDDLRAVYRHVNNDTPGTTDNSAISAFRIHPALAVGSYVQAGQIIGYMGDTGNAVGVPHLHFELRNPTRIPGDRTPFAPYPAVVEAQQREQCSIGIGPWAAPSGSGVDAPLPFLVSGGWNSSWAIGADGSVSANGPGALIAPTQGGCAGAADAHTWYGTTAQSPPDQAD